MVVNKVEQHRDYLSYVKGEPEELDILKKDILISVTSFFRDVKAFTAVGEHLQEQLANQARDGAFRIWIPGCATGEEAYTIAIVIAEILDESEIDKYRIQIFATDIDEDSIQVARRGEYPAETVKETSSELFQKYFTRQENQVCIKRRIRDMIVFAKQDLIKETSFMHMDLISCRNLLIYFNSDLQDKVLSLFHYSLKDGGLLLLGKSESVNNRKDMFSAVEHKWRLYKRKEASSRQLPEFHQTTAFNVPSVAKKKEKSPRCDYAWFESMLGLFDGCALVIDEQKNSSSRTRGGSAPHHHRQRPGI